MTAKPCVRIAAIAVALAWFECATALPNFIVFVADDAGWDDFGAYGHPAVRTPTIDALARDGWVADNAFLTSPQCSPSRISLLSGLYPHQSGTEDLHTPMPGDLRILPSYLADAGYVSGSFLKLHLGPAGAAQFDLHRDDLDLDAFLDAADGRPFFVWVGFIDPHRPYGDAPGIHRAADVRLPPTVLDTPGTRGDYVDYYDEIARLDADMERMLQVLERRGLRDDTYVLFLSDNGSPMPRAKGTLYDAGIKTPFVVTGPGVPSGRRHRPLVSMIDLAPTILDWAGLDVPVSMAGLSIRTQIEGGDTAAGREHVFSERNWHNADEHMRSVRTERYKLIWNNYIHLPHGTPADITASPSWQALRLARDAGALNPAQSLLFALPRQRVELYDTAADPAELHDLSADPAMRPVVQALMARLEAWMTATGDVTPERRRRDDNVDRTTGVKFSVTKPPLSDPR